MMLKLVATFLLFTSLVWATDSTSYSPKVTLRVTNGVVQNKGSYGGSTMAVGGLSASAYYFFHPRFALGLGYHFDFDYVQKTVPLSGLEGSMRWYLYGYGTRAYEVADGLVTERHDKFSVYIGGEMSQQNYYLGSHQLRTENQLPTGTSLSVQALLGADLMISRNFEFTAEFAPGIFTFAAVDDRYRLSSILVKVGINYLW